MAVQMPAHTAHMTAEDFDQFIRRPENEGRLLELIAGEMCEMPSNPFASMISVMIASALLQFVTPRQLGCITGEAGGYRIGGERYAPDVAFISRLRMPQLVKEGYNPLPPDRVVEVVYPVT